MADLTPLQGKTPAALRFYATKVFHARLKPNPHRFTYRVLSMVIDLDRLEEANASSWLFSVGRWNLLSFDVRNHGPRDAGIKPKNAADLRHSVVVQCEAAGIGQAISRIELLCFPSLLGKVFNPLSVYFCYHEDQIVATLYEVSNTFGERHTYVMPAKLSPDDGALIPQECDKLFYVSPFIDMAMRYRFLAQVPNEGLQLKIIERDRQGVVLTALMSGERLPLATGALLKAAFVNPLMGFKVVAAIHWEALKLWLKNYSILPRPLPPQASSTNQQGAFSIDPKSSKEGK